MEKLTEQEELVMRAIWLSDGGFIKDFIAHLTPQAPAIPYTTVASIVKNLERKKYVLSKKLGNSNFYTPLVSVEHYRKKSFHVLLKNYFKGSYRDLVASFVEEGALKPDELKALVDLIENQPKK